MNGSLALLDMRTPRQLQSTAPRDVAPAEIFMTRVALEEGKSVPKVKQGINVGWPRQPISYTKSDPVSMFDVKYCTALTAIPRKALPLQPSHTENMAPVSHVSGLFGLK